MMIRIVIWLAIMITVYTEVMKDGISFLTKENLESELEKGHTILAMWNKRDCRKCAIDLWDIRYLLFAFSNEPDFFILGTTTGTDPDMDNLYKIDPTYEGTMIRLFVKGSQSPFMRDDDVDLTTWVSMKTNYVPNEDHVFHLSDDTHAAFVKRTKRANALVFIYIPQNQDSQLISTLFFDTAALFRNEKTIEFAKVNCLETPGLCGFFNAPKVPTFRYVPYNETAMTIVQPDFTNGENMVDYLNHYLKTYINYSGKLNEHYGRVTTLDVLAQDFIVAEGKIERQKVMKKVSKLKNTYRESYKYYKLMRDILQGGDEVVQTELNLIASSLNDMSTQGKEYEKLIARRNIAHQFDPIQSNHNIITLTQYNFQSIVDGSKNVFIKYYISDCAPCEAMNEEYIAVAEEGVNGIIFAEMNVSMYPEYALRFHIEALPAMKFHAKNGDMRNPYTVDSERTKESIKAYCENLLKGEEEMEL